MEKCSWTLQNFAEGSPILTLVCDFRAARFPTTRKMQLVYDAAAELSDILSDADLPCLIGVGPLNNDFQEEQWQLVLIPDNGNLPEPELERKRRELVIELHGYSVHLNETPKHYLLNPNHPPPTEKPLLN